MTHSYVTNSYASVSSWVWDIISASSEFPAVRFESIPQTSCLHKWQSPRQTDTHVSPLLRGQASPGCGDLVLLSRIRINSTPLTFKYHLTDVQRKRRKTERCDGNLTGWNLASPSATCIEPHCRRAEIILDIKAWVFTDRRAAVIKSSKALALSYYPCPPLVQPHHAPFVPAVFSSPCSFQDMPINLSVHWVDILVSLWWPPLGPLCSLVGGQAHGLLALAAGTFLSVSLPLRL